MLEKRENNCTRQEMQQDTRKKWGFQSEESLGMPEWLERTNRLLILTSHTKAMVSSLSEVSPAWKKMDTGLLDGCHIQIGNIVSEPELARAWWKTVGSLSLCYGHVFKSRTNQDSQIIQGKKTTFTVPSKCTGTARAILCCLVCSPPNTLWICFTLSTSLWF